MLGKGHDHLVYGWWPNTEVTLKVGFCRWLSHDLAVVVDEGEVLPLFRRPVCRCVCRHEPVSEMLKGECLHRRVAMGVDRFTTTRNRLELSPYRWQAR